MQPQDHILEIGFGPGLAIRELARRATDGFVLGIDHSEVMVRQAAIRNRAAIEQGRVNLRFGSAMDLGDFSEMFDKALMSTTSCVLNQRRGSRIFAGRCGKAEWRLSHSRAVPVPQRDNQTRQSETTSGFATLASSASRGRR